MNLNELVYRLENSMGIDYDLLSQAANKLRQQQTMIDEYIKATDYWMKLCQEANANYTPQIKELSDEEILSKFMNAWKDFLMVEQGTNGVMNVQMVALHFYKLGLNHENL
jgi:hypothetical protein